MACGIRCVCLLSWRTGEAHITIFATVKTVAGIAALRDLGPDDIPAIADYWLLSPTEFLDHIGIDRKRLGTAEEIHGRFAGAIRTGDKAQSRIGLAIMLDERLAGYTLLNRYSDEVNYSHWHIMLPELRCRGISSTLYPHRIKTYFDLAPMTRLIHQTRTRNVGVNRMLDKFVPVAETKNIEKPDGVALPGDFHIRYVRREEIPRLFCVLDGMRTAGQSGLE